jgi:hypothetical protein
MSLLIIFPERVRHKPILKTGLPENVTAPFAGNATFECHIAVSDAQATIQWLKHYKVNGSYIDKETGQAYYDVIQASLPYGVSLYDLTKYSRFASAWHEKIN